MLYTKTIGKEQTTYDLIVCGGGMSGFATAFCAAEEGLNVILIERGTCIGGTCTQGLVNHILGGRTYENGKLVTGIGGLYARLEKILLKNATAVDVNTIDMTNPPQGWYPNLAAGVAVNGEKLKLILEQMLLENKVKILYNTDIIDVVKDDNGKLQGVVVHNKKGLYCIEGKYFADATGDADICGFADSPYMIGDENGGVAPSSLELHVDNIDVDELSEYMKKTDDRRFRKIIPSLREQGIWDFPYEIFISVMLTEKDVFMINTNRMVGIDGLDADSLTQGIIEARKENFKLLDIMRKYFPGFKNARIRNVASMFGVRESRRIVGEYVLTVDDLAEEKNFNDAIAYSVYGWDLPDPKKPSHQPHFQKHKSLYTPIPYRCLLPQKVDNLIAVGRCISVERPVLGPLRVMGPCIAMGEAAGYATKLAISNNVKYKDVDIERLKERIIEKGGILL